jgi:hypothetical protein
VTGRPLWACPSCGRTFANRNQTHTCATLAALDAHFVNCEPRVRELFDRFVEALRECGPFEILPEKTRIAFHLRMSFAQLTTRRRHLVGHLVLRRSVEHPLITKVEPMSARCVVHHFTLEGDFDDAFRALIVESYATGEQT